MAFRLRLQPGHGVDNEMRMSNDAARRDLPAKFGTVVTPSGLKKRVPVEFVEGVIEREQELEEWLNKNFAALELDAALIGRQVAVTDNKSIDLFGITRKGQLCIVELKRDTAERDVFIQIVDYARLLSGFLSDQINEMCACATQSSTSLSDIYSRHFNSELPAKRLREPMLVVVAKDFADSETEMALYLNQEHKFCIRLISYEAKRTEGELVLKFQHEVYPEDQLRVTSEMPDQVLEVRVRESSQCLWNQCKDEAFIPSSAELVRGITGLNPEEPLWLLIYLDKYGYVAYGMIEEVASVATASADMSSPVKMKWEYAVELEKHVFRGKHDQPKREVEQLLDEEKWGILVGQLRFSAERARRKSGDGGKRLPYKRKRVRKTDRLNG